MTQSVKLHHALHPPGRPRPWHTPLPACSVTDARGPQKPAPFEIALVEKDGFTFVRPVARRPA